VTASQRSPLDTLLALPAATQKKVLAGLSADERSYLTQELEQRERELLPFRTFLQSPDYCELDLSPMVAAIADAADGVRPSTIDDATSSRYFGCSLDGLPRQRRRTVAVQAGGRGGKTSRLLAPKALHAAWTVPLPTLAANEHAVSLIVSSDLVFAKQALSFCIGYVERSPKLRDALVGEPTTESLTLRRPDGKLVDVRVRAAGAKGKGGRAFTLVFAGFDEYCFFYDESGVVNDREIFRACSPRIVPGGQLWMVSTPWIQGVGVLEEELAANFGNHSETLAVRGVGTRALNPTWDPTGEIEAKERRTDPDNADREISAKALTAGSSHFFSREAIEAAFHNDLSQKLPHIPGRDYGAGGDPGFKRNSSALAIIEKVEGKEGQKDRFRLALLEERKPTPGMPLLPEGVAADFADLMLGYGTRELATDSHEIEDVRDAMQAKGCNAVIAPAPSECFADLRTLLHEGRLELPEHPRLRSQLREVLLRPMPGGGTQIHSPKKADGSHGDLVSALSRAAWKVLQGNGPASRSRTRPTPTRPVFG
jgi:hypothetical protein